MAAAARAGTKCLEVCGYCCQVIACGVETLRTIWRGITFVCTCGQGWKGMAYNATTVFTSEEDPDDKDFDLPIVVKRKFTDVPGLIVFVSLLIGMCIAMNRALTYGFPHVYNYGVDSWANVCNYAYNTPFSDLSFSGIDMTDRSKVLILDFITHPDKITAESVNVDYFQLCVRQCPSEQGDFSCVDYLRDYSNYPATLRAQLCGSSPPIQIPVFVEKNRRCIPEGVFDEVAIQRQNSLLNLYSDSWLHNLVHDCGVCAAELTWLILIAVAFTLVFIVIIHAAASALCWYSFATFFIVGCCATGYMWYLYSLISAADKGVNLYSTRRLAQYKDPNTFEGSVLRAAVRLFPMTPSFRNASQQLDDSYYGTSTGAGTAAQAGYSVVFRDVAIYSTVAVVFFSIVSVFVGRRNMEAGAHLFEEGTNAMLTLKWVYLLPITSILSLVFAFGLWMHTLTYLTAVFLPQPEVVVDLETGISKGYYVPDSVYSFWVLLFEFIGIIWVINFVLGCQHLIVCLTIGTWYFTIDKEDIYRPIRVALSRLTRKHLGSVVMGGFLVGYFGILRAPLSFLQTRVAGATEKALREQREIDGEPVEAEHIYDEVYDDDDYGPYPSSRKNSHIYDSVPNDRSRGSRSSRSGGSRPSGKRRSTRGSHIYSEITDESDEDKETQQARIAVYTWNLVNKMCLPCFWFLNSILVYISDLNYSVVALRGFWFMQGGRLIRDRLKRKPKLKNLTAVPSYAFFLGKLTVTLIVLPIGFLLLKDKDGVFLYGYPLAVGALLSFLVAHVFFYLFDACTGAIFVCYLEDIAANRGNDSAPYFGSKDFFENFQNAVNEVDPDDAPPYTKIHYNAGEESANPPSKKRKSYRGSDDDDFDDDDDDDDDDDGDRSRRVSFHTTNERRGSARKPIQTQPKSKYPSNNPKSAPPRPPPPSKRKPPRPPQPSRRDPSPADPSSLFLLMPEKRKRKSLDERIYDEPYEEDDETYDIDQLFEEAQDAADQFDDERERKKDNKNKKQSKQKDQKPQKDQKSQKAKKSQEKGDKNARRSSKTAGNKQQKGSAKGDKASKSNRKNSSSAKQEPKQNRRPSKSTGEKQRRPSNNKGKADNLRKNSTSKSPKRPAPSPPKDAKKAANKAPKRPPPPRPPPPSKQKGASSGKTGSTKKPEASKLKTDKLKVPKQKGGKDFNVANKLKKPKGKLQNQEKGFKKGTTKVGKKLKSGKAKVGNKVKGLKAPKLKGLNAPKLKGLKAPKTKGFKAPKLKGLKAPKMKLPGKAFKVPRGRMGPKMGAAGAAASGVSGAVNVADGLLRIAGKKQDAENAAAKAAYGTRGRSKATQLISHIVENKEKMTDQAKGPFWISNIVNTYRNKRDFLLGGKKIVEDVDQEWDEVEEEEEEEEEEERPRKTRVKWH